MCCLYLYSFLTLSSGFLDHVLEKEGARWLVEFDLRLMNGRTGRVSWISTVKKISSVLAVNFYLLGRGCKAKQKKLEGSFLWVFEWLPQVFSLTRVTCTRSVVTLVLERIWFVLLPELCKLNSNLSVRSLSRRFGTQTRLILLCCEGGIALLLVIMMEQISVGRADDSEKEQKNRIQDLNEHLSRILLKKLNVEVLKLELSGFIERVEKLFDHRI